MIIFLYGADDYRREQKKRSIFAEFIKKYSGLNIGVFDLAEEKGLTDFAEFVRSQSIFEQKKFVALENSFEEKTREKLAEVLKPLLPAKDIIILLSERKEPVKALQFLLTKPALSQTFPNLAGPEWTGFIKTEAKKFGFIPEDAAVQFLADVYKDNTWGLITELEKLGSLNGSTSLTMGKAAITRKDLESFDLEVAPNYWTTLNALKGHDIKNRLWALEKLLALGDPAPKIFNILASQWREKLSVMAEYDIKIKSGKLEYEEALVDLVIG
jgi:DNA polymerase III delta subunit